MDMNRMNAIFARLRDSLLQTALPVIKEYYKTVYQMETRALNSINKTDTFDVIRSKVSVIICCEHIKKSLLNEYYVTMFTQALNTINKTLDPKQFTSHKESLEYVQKGGGKHEIIFLILFLTIVIGLFNGTTSATNIIQSRNSEVGTLSHVKPVPKTVDGVQTLIKELRNKDSNPDLGDVYSFLGRFMKDPSQGFDEDYTLSRRTGPFFNNFVEKNTTDWNELYNMTKQLEQFKHIDSLKSLQKEQFIIFIEKSLVVLNDFLADEHETMIELCEVSVEISTEVDLPITYKESVARRLEERLHELKDNLDDTRKTNRQIAYDIASDEIAKEENYSPSPTISAITSLWAPSPASEITNNIFDVLVEQRVNTLVQDFDTISETQLVAKFLETTTKNDDNYQDTDNNKRMLKQICTTLFDKPNSVQLLEGNLIVKHAAKSFTGMRVILTKVLVDLQNNLGNLKDTTDTDSIIDRFNEFIKYTDEYNNRITRAIRTNVKDIDLLFDNLEEFSRTNKLILEQIIQSAYPGRNRKLLDEAQKERKQFEVNDELEKFQSDTRLASSQKGRERSDAAHNSFLMGVKQTVDQGVEKVLNPVSNVLTKIVETGEDAGSYASEKFSDGITFGTKFIENNTDTILNGTSTIIKQASYYGTDALKSVLGNINDVIMSNPIMVSIISGILMIIFIGMCVLPALGGITVLSSISSIFRKTPQYTRIIPSEFLSQPIHPHNEQSIHPRNEKMSDEQLVNKAKKLVGAVYGRNKLPLPDKTRMDLDTRMDIETRTELENIRREAHLYLEKVNKKIKEKTKKVLKGNNFEKNLKKLDELEKNILFNKTVVEEVTSVLGTKDDNIFTRKRHLGEDLRLGEASRFDTFIDLNHEPPDQSDLPDLQPEKKQKPDESMDVDNNGGGTRRRKQKQTKRRKKHSKRKKMRNRKYSRKN